MKFAVLFTILTIALNVQAFNCPEQTYSHTIYNDCTPSPERVCALWYSKTICVKDPIICTMDINPWGHPSLCNCGDDFLYDQTLGKCRLKEGLSCSKNINAWGFPSYCKCDDGLTYDPTKGHCLINN